MKKKKFKKVERNEWGRTFTAEVALQKMVTKFAERDIGKLIMYSRAELPDGHPAATWSKRNRLMVLAQTNTLDCRNAGAWKKIGRHLKPGVKAAYISKPYAFAYKTITNESGEEEVIRWPKMYTFTPVHPIQNTAGEGNDFVARLRPLLPLENLAEELGVQVVTGVILPKGTLGDATTNGTRIRVGTDTDRGQVKVFFHELGHVLDAKLNGNLKGGQQTDDEAVAEFVSSVLMMMYGWDDSGFAHRYIQYYAGEGVDPLDEVMRNLSRIQKIINYVDSFLG